MAVLFLFEIVITNILFLSSVYGFSVAVTPSNLLLDSNQGKNNLLILGLGRVGSEVAKQAVESNFFNTVIGTVRNYNSDTRNDFNIQCIPFDIESIRLSAKNCRYIFVTIPPPGPNNNNNDDLDDKNNEQNLENIFRLVVEELVTSSCWIGIISTTGVYGDHDGTIVTEDSECKATSTAQRYVEYENQWIELATRYHHNITIFRCAGIYSNDQSALHTVYKKGLRPTGSSSSSTTTSVTKSVTNRIHVVDIARAVIASMKQHYHLSKVNVDSPSSSGNNNYYRIYNLADNHPENRDVVFEYAANLMKKIGVTIVRSDPIAATSLSRSGATPSSTGRTSRRLTDRKIVSNQRMLQELLPESGLLFPTYKEGLDSILNDPSNPWWTDRS